MINGTFIDCGWLCYVAGLGCYLYIVLYELVFGCGLRLGLNTSHKCKNEDILEPFVCTNQLSGSG